MKFPLEASLNRAEAKSLMTSVVDGQMSHKQISEFLTTLEIKGETSEEVLGFIDALLAKAICVDFKSSSTVLDVCGTGGDSRDGSSSFNVSTAVAFVVAAAGVVVAKHGNRSVSSRSGSFDVLEALGVRPDRTPSEVIESLSQRGLAFLFAPVFHPTLGHVAPVRKALGIRTVFNLFGPLLNPVQLNTQLIGVYKPELLSLMAEVLKGRGLREAMIVHGDDGMDELSLTASTKIAHLKNQKIEMIQVSPEDFGLKRAKSEDIQGGSPQENAAIIRSLLRGEKSPKRDVVLMNASAALLISGKVDNFKDGVKLASEAIDSGRALNLIEAG